MNLPHSATIKKTGKRYIVRLYDKQKFYLGKAVFYSYDKAYQALKPFKLGLIQTDFKTFPPLRMLGELLDC